MIHMENLIPYDLKNFSYAQNLEDYRAIFALSKVIDVSEIRYVEIGVHHPWINSTTAAMYAAGGSGVLVDPLSEFDSLIRATRSRDRWVNVFAGDGSVDQEEFFLIEGTGLSTKYAVNAEKAKERGFKSSTTVVPAVRTSQIFDSSGLNEVHFLSIDVEGEEFAVLSGLDFDIHRPWIICVEGILPGEFKKTQEGVRDLLLGKNYLHTHFDGLNDWFVSEERRSIANDVARGIPGIELGSSGWSTKDSYFIQKFKTWLYNTENARQELISGLKTQTASIHTDGEIIELEGNNEIPCPSDHDEGPGERNFEQISSNPFSIAKKNLYTFFPQSWLAKVAKDLQTRHLSLTSEAFLDLNSKPKSERSTWVSNFESRAEDWNHSFFDYRPLRGKHLRQARFAARNWENFNCDPMFSLDGNGDLEGSSFANLISRINMAEVNTHGKSGKRQTCTHYKLIVDVRSMQDTNYSSRGIGSFGSQILDSILAQFARSDVAFLIDESLEPIDERYREVKKITGRFENGKPIFRCTGFISLSPMTHDIWPVHDFLVTASYSLAVFYDIIPFKYSDLYLRTEFDRISYAAKLDYVSRFKEVWTISNTTSNELNKVLASFSGKMKTVWPKSLESRNAKKFSKGDYVVVMGGQEPRKNLFAALAGWSLATSKLENRPKIHVIGYAKAKNDVLDLAISAGLRPGDTVCEPFLEEEEKCALISGATLLIVPSFDEGLSLPVIESINLGTPVVASNIAAHRELLGKNFGLFNPLSCISAARSIQLALVFNERLYIKQSRKLHTHNHVLVEKATLSALKRFADKDTSSLLNKESNEVDKNSPVEIPIGKTKRVAVLTPWPPQKSGVADYSRATFGECQVQNGYEFTIFAWQPRDKIATSNINVLSHSLLFDSEVRNTFDEVIVIMGNSAFHSIGLWYLRLFGGVTVVHDFRQNDFYLYLDGLRGLLNRYRHALGRGSVTTSEVESEFERHEYSTHLLEEISTLSSNLITHDPTVASLIGLELGRNVSSVIFVPLRPPLVGASRSRQESESHIRSLLKLDKDQIVVSSFGHMDENTKCISSIVDACLLLRSQGQDVRLIFAGENGEFAFGKDTSPAFEILGVDDSWIDIFGRVDDSLLLDILHASNLTIQLRRGDMKGTSGPVIDSVAHAKATVVTENLSLIGFPEYVFRVKNDFGIRELSETILEAAKFPAGSGLEQMRDIWISAHRPQDYMQNLIEVLTND